MKRMIALVMCLLIGLCMIPTTAMADLFMSKAYVEIGANVFGISNGGQYGWITGGNQGYGIFELVEESSQLQKSTAQNQGQGNYKIRASYTNADGLTLWLKDVSLTDTISIYAASATIILEGTNSISVSSNSNVYGITGKTDNDCLIMEGAGTLNISAIAIGDHEAYGIQADDYLCISDRLGSPTVTITAEAMDGMFAFGIHSKGDDIEIKGATIDIKSRANGNPGGAFGIYAAQIRILDDSLVKIHASGTDMDATNPLFRTGSISVANSLSILAGNTENPTGKPVARDANGVVSGTDLHYKYMIIGIVPTTTFTVTFDSNGGSAVDDQEVESGAKVSKPTDPTLPGYTFGGWYSEDTVFDFDTPITTATTLKAHWTKEVVSYSGYGYYPPTKTVKSAITGDTGFAIYVCLSISSVLGMGYVSKKKV